MEGIEVSYDTNSSRKFWTWFKDDLDRHLNKRKIIQVRKAAMRYLLIHWLLLDIILLNTERTYYAIYQSLELNLRLNLRLIESEYAFHTLHIVWISVSGSFQCDIMTTPQLNYILDKYTQKQLQIRRFLNLRTYWLRRVEQSHIHKIENGLKVIRQPREGMSPWDMSQRTDQNIFGVSKERASRLKIERANRQTCYQQESMFEIANTARLIICVAPI